MTTTHDTLLAIAPTPDPLDTAWSAATLESILADEAVSATSRRGRRGIAVLAASGVLALTTGVAVAAGGPVQVVRDAIQSFAEQPNTTGNGLGTLPDPELVAQFPAESGVIAVWLATSSTGKVCTAMADGWDGETTPTRDELSYGCGGTVLGRDGEPIELTRPDQIGGFFKDDQGPLLYGVAPYPHAVRVQVSGHGVDRSLPVRPDSLGFGAALPEAEEAPAVRVTFLDAAGTVLGSQRWVAPVG